MLAGSEGGARQWKASIPKAARQTQLKHISALHSRPHVAVPSIQTFVCFVFPRHSLCRLFFGWSKKAYSADMAKRGENLIKQAEIIRFWVGNYQLQIAPRVIHCQCLCFVTTRAEKVCCSFHHRIPWEPLKINLLHSCRRSNVTSDVKLLKLNPFALPESFPQDWLQPNSQLGIKIDCFEVFADSKLIIIIEGGSSGLIERKGGFHHNCSAYVLSCPFPLPSTVREGEIASFSSSGLLMESLL